VKTFSTKVNTKLTLVMSLCLSVLLKEESYLRATRRSKAGFERKTPIMLYAIVSSESLFHSRWTFKLQVLRGSIILAWNAFASNTLHEPKESRKLSTQPDLPSTRLTLEIGNNKAGAIGI